MPPIPTIDEEYIVKEITAQCETNGDTEFLVKWLGYPEQDTWEPLSHVYDTEALQKWKDRNTEEAHVANKGNSDGNKNISYDSKEMPLEPQNYDDAISCPEAPLWRKAITSELNSIKANHIWDIIPRLPPGNNLIGCRWIFKCKLNSDGTVSRYKARLVAKGYSQQYGIDYDETYAPVAKFALIRILLSIGAMLNLEIHQMDVKTAFLNGELEEEVYMAIPDGIDRNELTSESVCKLCRTLYGLKQSPRMWNKCIDDHLTSQGFIRSNSDHGVYVRCKNDNSIAIIALYVDDLILLTDSMPMMNELKGELKMAFEMMDCGDIHHFLGLCINRDRPNGTLTLDQGHLINQILNRFNMSDCKPVSMPLDASNHLELAIETENNSQTETACEDATLINPTLFRQITGSLMYLMTRTRPDIAIAISTISQFNSNPTNAHLQAAKRIIRYLK